MRARRTACLARAHLVLALPSRHWHSTEQLEEPERDQAVQRVLGSSRLAGAAGADGLHLSAYANRWVP